MEEQTRKIRPCTEASQLFCTKTRLSNHSLVRIWFEPFVSLLSLFGLRGSIFNFHCFGTDDQGLEDM